MFKDSAARVKLFVSTIRMNVRIAAILSSMVFLLLWKLVKAWPGAWSGVGLSLLC
jgi:hypothetical protein